MIAPQNHYSSTSRAQDKFILDTTTLLAILTSLAPSEDREEEGMREMHEDGEGRNGAAYVQLINYPISGTRMSEQYVKEIHEKEISRF